MKTHGIAGLLLVLSGCATTDYGSLPLSTASMSNLTVNELYDPDAIKHQLEISFDYDIRNFQPGLSLYNCTVQFFKASNGTRSKIPPGKHPCTLRQASGAISIVWPGILDRSISPTVENLTAFAFPIRYIVTIQQKTGKYSSQIIAQSDIQASIVGQSQ